MDFSNYLFRASQLSKLTVGNIGLSEAQGKRISELEYERDKGINLNGNKVKWTNNKNDEYKKLIKIRDEEPIPKTLQTELRKIHRAEKYNRTFSFTNKYVQKGILMEEDGITVYNHWCLKMGRKVFFKKNDKRLYNEFISGEPDLCDSNDIENCEEGFDIKCSWDLDTFPFNGDKLDKSYEYQNQGYLWLTGAKRWKTVYVLVNAPDHLIHNEKQKIYYGLGAPVDGSELYNKYIQLCKEIEQRMIFNRAEFEKRFPLFDWETTKEEWEEGGFDIPIEDRVIEKDTTPNQELIDDLKERIKFSRQYLNKL